MQCVRVGGVEGDEGEGERLEEEYEALLASAKVFERSANVL